MRFGSDRKCPRVWTGENFERIGGGIDPVNTLTLRTVYYSHEEWHGMKADPPNKLAKYDHIEPASDLDDMKSIGKT